jgi:hypothetical protein
MYKPVCPVMLTKAKDDDRPQFGPPIISARSHFNGIADMELAVKECESGNVLFWVFGSTNIDGG